jgi:rubrerythrin
MNPEDVMSIEFNAKEIFEVAVQIEKNGNLFYTRASEKSTDPKVRKMFASLADMEKVHERTFEAIKNELKGKETELVTYDPQDETVLYLQAFASGHIFDLKENLSSFFSGKEDTKAVVKKAISLEKDSIVFYLGLEDLVPEELGKDKVYKIINEEKTHVRILSGMLDSL